MIFIQEYTMFWFGFDDARRHLFVWNIILKHDVVINYQRIPYKLGIVCIFLLPEIGTVKRRLTDNFSWGLFVWDKLFHGRGSTHLSQVMPRPPFEICRFSQWPRFTKCMVWYYSTICQAKTRDQNANKLRKKVFGQRKTKRKKI